MPSQPSAPSRRQRRMMAKQGNAKVLESRGQGEFAISSGQQTPEFNKGKAAELRHTRWCPPGAARTEFRRTVVWYAMILEIIFSEGKDTSMNATGIAKRASRLARDIRNIFLIFAAADVVTVALSLLYLRSLRMAEETPPCSDGVDITLVKRCFALARLRMGETLSQESVNEMGVELIYARISLCEANKFYVGQEEFEEWLAILRADCEEYGERHGVELVKSMPASFGGLDFEGSGCF
ncbi:hypothetical protein BKA70DRAFT_1420332 [Coprinopsis sp. MPI-PUGE-AT-0042]|nr:hypothetical protein BKA70DRAFT_1420332 [Coprinopsis sp. MPI-PUGE-AT-0042]